MLSQPRSKVFISYSHKDSGWLERLRIHTRPVERIHRIEIWDDTRINKGSLWETEIEKAIQCAKVAVLLISADFLASDFISTKELPLLLQAAEDEGALILPVILSPSAFEDIEELARFQSVNNSSSPLTSLSYNDQERVLSLVASKIKAAFVNQSSRDLPPPMPAQPIPSQLAPEEFQATRQAHRQIPSATWLTIAAIITSAAIIIALIHAHRLDPPALALLRGQVLDNSAHSAIAGALIKVNIPGEPQRTSTSDSDGKFNLPVSPKAANISVRVEANGYEPKEETIPAISDKTQSFFLDPVVQYTVAISDGCSQKRISGGALTVKGPNSTIKKDLDKNGEARFEANQSVHKATIQIECEGYEPVAQPVDLPANDSIKIVMQKKLPQKDRQSMNSLYNACYKSYLEANLKSLKFAQTKCIQAQKFDRCNDRINTLLRMIRNALGVLKQSRDSQ